MGLGGQLIGQYYRNRSPQVQSPMSDEEYYFSGGSQGY